MREEKTRYHLADGIRGIAVINMVLYHFLYDVYVVYDRLPAWCDMPAVRLWQQMICWTFILISGFVWTWGKTKNLRRGLALNLLGFLFSFITVTVIPEQAIWFGLLNFMGCAVLILLPLEKMLEKIPAACGLAVCFLLFLLCRRIQYGQIGIAGRLQMKVPDLLYDIRILTPLGFPYRGFHSSDYFPLLPWIFLYLCGFYFNRIFMRHDTWQVFTRRRLPFLSALGSKTLWVYLIHQPLSMLICFLIFG